MEHMHQFRNPLEEDYETFLTFEKPFPCYTAIPLHGGGIWNEQKENICNSWSRQLVHNMALLNAHSYLGTYGTYTSLEIQEKQESIVRFVVAMQGGKGSTTVIAPVDPELASGFHVW